MKYVKIFFRSFYLKIYYIGIKIFFNFILIYKVVVEEKNIGFMYFLVMFCIKILLLIKIIIYIYKR